MEYLEIIKKIINWLKADKKRSLVLALGCAFVISIAFFAGCESLHVDKANLEGLEIVRK